MKETHSSLYFLGIFIILIISAPTNSVKVSSSIESQESNQPPTVEELVRFVKPLIEKPYTPIEVNSLDANIPIPGPMTPAEIIGDVEHSQGFQEKPVIFSTIISPKSTQIKNSSTGVEEASHKTTRKISEFSVPIEIEGNKSQSQDIPQVAFPEPSEEADFMVKKFQEIGKKDYDLIKTSLETGKTNEDKINNLLIASNTLKSEVSKLVNFFSNQVEEILKTQSLEKRIEGLLDRYEKKDDDENVEKLLDDLYKSLLSGSNSNSNNNK